MKILRPGGLKGLLALAAGLSLALLPTTAVNARDLTVGVAQLPPNLEPGRVLSNAGTRVTYSMFDTLIRRDFLSAEGGGGSVLVPGLAVSWTRLGPDTLELKLRDGVAFHNGAPLTAADVAFTFSKERFDRLPEGAAYFGVLETVEVVDPLTVRFKTKAPDPLLEQRLASWASWIVNAEDWKAKAEKGEVRDPVGTGPYRLVEFSPDQQIVLEANESYFGGAPNAGKVTFRQVPETAGRIAGLVSGEFDIITNIAPDQIAELERYDGVDVRTVTLANSHVLAYNDKQPVLADKRVRQALNLGINRELIVEALWGGKAVIPQGHQYPEYGDLFDATRSAPQYDPDRARALLAEAGYKGEPIIYTSQGNYYTNGLAVAQVIMAMWEEIGINVSLQNVENLEAVPNEQLWVRNWSNSTRYPDPVGAIWIAWGPGGNAQKVWDSWEAPARFNEVGAALQQETDVSKRQALAKELLDIWEDDAPGTVLFQPIEVYGVRADVKWQPYTFYYMDLRNYNLDFE
jgi:peptide/nickel transport system substrate-binding protein